MEINTQKFSWRRFWILLLPTWFYTGFFYRLMPWRALRRIKASATWGSFFALPLLAALWYFAHTIWIWVGIWGVLIVAALFLIPLAERELGPTADPRGRMRTHDQNEIVIDEVFGMFIAVAPTLFIDIVEPARFAWYLAGAFLLFRFFDIAKVWPANFFDKESLPADVIVDDVVAGIYTAIILLAVLALEFWI
ncbi:MAG: phosphatidylglycerophosphatase A [Candidatus Magasanikbacteria bacterium]|nr:phosphatidylglycerophosphatase A [Candidatus Magasanikbacteria bacterium]